MEKVYEELDEVKAENEKLKIDHRNKTELLNNLKKLQTEQSVEIQKARSVMEKQGFEIDEKTREASELKVTNEELQGCLKEKDLVLKRVEEANEKLRVNGEDKCKEFEEERMKLVLALDEASEKKIDMEQKNNVYRAEIEGLKGLLDVAEKKKIEVEKMVKVLRETRGRDEVMVKIEEDKSKVEEKLKWKKEQFKHLEEAYEKVKKQFECEKKERDEERRMLYDEINSLETKLDSQVRICEDVEKKLQMCNGLLSQEESRRKRLEIEVSEFKLRYEDVFAECEDTRTKLDELVSKRDEDVAELRQKLCVKEIDLKEMKYENRKLEQENRDLVSSLKELQEALIQGSGNSALTKMKNKFRNLENVHKNCLVNLRNKEGEWSSLVNKMEEEIKDYKLQLQSKEATVKELEVEIDNSYSVIAKLRLQYEEVSVMFLVLSEAVSEAQSKLEGEEIEEQSYVVETENVELVKANKEIEEERERVACLLKRIEILEHFEEESLEMKKEVERYKETVEEGSRFQIQMKEKMKEAEKDYEEKLLQVCDAVDNTNSDLVAEREKVMALRIQMESFGVVKEKEIQKYKEMIEESEKRCVVLESESKENIRELCIKLEQEVEKAKSIDQSEEKTRKKLEEVTRSQVMLQEKLGEVSEGLEMANSELFEKTTEVYQVEFQLWVWKSIAKRLKTELEENQNLRKRVEASLLEQVGIGEGMRQEVEFLKEESVRREFEYDVFTYVTKLQKEEEFCVVKKKLEISLMSESLLLEKLESKEMMIEELEEKLEKSEESVSCFGDLETEKENLLGFIGGLEKRMMKICEEDMKLMRTLERSDGIGKENKVDDDSSRLVMKHEAIEEEEERSPFRELNH